jgi:hypothetical protein
MTILAPRPYPVTAHSVCLVHYAEHYLARGCSSSAVPSYRPSRLSKERGCLKNHSNPCSIKTFRNFSRRYAVQPLSHFSNLLNISLRDVTGEYKNAAKITKKHGVSNMFVNAHTGAFPALFFHEGQVHSAFAVLTDLLRIFTIFLNRQIL